MPDSVSSRASSQALTQVLKVALPSPLRRLFDYLPCKTPDCGWQPGLRVRVPFGRRDVIGIVVELADHSDLSPSQLRVISETLDDAPLPKDWLWLCRFAARYYQHSLGDTLHHAMPARLRQGYPMAGRTQTLWRARGEDVEETLSRAPKQAEL
ncbi:MAG TPA: primosomal protein N', partial [Halomonas sp.]|nr:primosomal protein N' [Halomonas sp.]